LSGKSGVILLRIGEDGHNEGPVCESGATIKIFDTVADAKKYQEEHSDQNFRRMKVTWR